MSVEQVMDVIQIVKGRDVGATLDITQPAKSLEELFELFSLDPDEWVVVDSSINQWPTTAKINDEMVQTHNHQIKAKLRPKINTTDATKVLESLKEEYSKRGPVLPLIKRDRSSTKQMLELMITDHHLGKMSINDDYSLEKASEIYMDTVWEAMSRAAAEKVHEIVLVMGNDYLHVDNVKQQTTSGTQMEYNSMWGDLFQAGAMLQVRAIDALKQMAPVRIIPVPGNHDEQSVISMAYLLQAWYRNDDNVHVESPKRFQYWTDGFTLLGFTHGNIKAQQLPLVMAKENPHFSQAKITEWHCGHLHQTKSQKFPVEGDKHEEGGVVIRIFPALCPADSWHEKHGWHLSSRRSTAMLWEQGKGQVAEYSILPK